MKSHVKYNENEDDNTDQLPKTIISHNTSPQINGVTKQYSNHVAEDGLARHINLEEVYLHTPDHINNKKLTSRWSRDAERVCKWLDKADDSVGEDNFGSVPQVGWKIFTNAQA